MNASHQDLGFHVGGYIAWWRGLRAEQRRLKQEFAAAQSEEQRRLIESQQQALQRQQQDAVRNGDRWLF
jgi:hypothetical protein